ncbi:NYN domain-containing protein [uncultured Serinicoccus sp.]|uniref:NYN domain-containing protein n=1 Tax=uncultured Serinicoccus sp. TaxID=735514 RepID=UPI00261274A9|nr:NYN domain-containing protein [uncultured Serinicoccus sp.]
MQVLIVDGANVVGSRPDGWWRDRAGAARRLHGALTAADLSGWDEVVLVLEGDARRGWRPGQHGRLRTVHAAQAGDDAIVEEVKNEHATGNGRGVTVVTADRALRERVQAAGASVKGPRWLLDRSSPSGRQDVS